MQKTNLFIDFDGTITHSIKAYCDAYNEIYLNRSGFVPADYMEVKKYDLSDQCPLANTREKVSDIFASYEFWHWLEFMPGAQDALYRLNKNYNVIICSIGTKPNIARKAKWIEANLPFIDNCIFINNGMCSMDKSIIDMSGGIIIDDVASNLITSSAKTKLCFGNLYDWNRNIPRDIKRIKNWNEVVVLLNNIEAI